MATQAREFQQQPSVSFKNILLATDFSDASERAFAYATAIARLHGSKIYLVHVISPGSNSLIPEIPERLRREAAQEIESLANRSELKQIARETVLRTGSVWRVLSAVIYEQNIELIVLGTHGRGGFKKLFLGSVAEEVVRRASCPVITVGPHIDALLRTTADIHRILLATDFHPAAEKALHYAGLLANQFQAKLILLHVLPPAALPRPELAFFNETEVKQWQVRETAATKQKLVKRLAAYVTLWSEPEYAVEFDFTAERILKVAAEQNADLIVVGVNHPMSAKLSAHFLRAVTYELIRDAKCPVLTVSA